MATCLREPLKWPARPQFLTPVFYVIKLNLADDFQTHFDIVPADDAHMRDKVFRIRHQVYCEELGFEPHRTNQREEDQFDQNSIHCLLLHKPSQTYVGCVRLILADTDALAPGFPFEQVCGKSLRWAFNNSNKTGRHKFGEISRLAITSDFRRSRHETQALNAGNPKPESRDDDAKRLFPSIALGLYLAIAAMGLSKGLDGVFAMMEPRLARQLRRFGIHCQQVGDAVTHRGTRVPYFISSKSLVGNLKLECRTLLGKIQDCLALPYAPCA